MDVMSSVQGRYKFGAFHGPGVFALDFLFDRGLEDHSISAWILLRLSSLADRRDDIS